MYRIFFTDFNSGENSGLTRPELKQVSVELCYYIETIFKEQSESSSDEAADSSEFSDELSEYQN